MKLSRKHKVSLLGVALALMFVAPMPILGTNYYLNLTTYLSFLVPDSEAWNADPVREGDSLLFEPAYGSHPYHLGLTQEIRIASETDMEKTAAKIQPGTDRAYTKEAFRNGTYSPLGKPAPDFELMATDGKWVRLSDYKGKIVAFQFAAMTCPPARVSVNFWTDLYNEKYKDNEEVVMLTVYSRERHPGERGFEQFRHARTFGEKFEYASMLAELSNIPVAVDPISEDTLGKYAGDLANAAFVVDKEGILVFKSEWSNPNQIEHVIDTLLEYYDRMENGRPSVPNELTTI